MRGSLHQRFSDKYIPEPESYGVIGREDFPQRTMLAHHAAWLLYRGQLPGLGHDIMHRCDNRLCVNPDHLLVGSRQDNMQDAVRKRRVRRGEEKWNVILSEGIIRKIRASASRNVALATRYGVAQSTICSIRKGREWKWVK